VKIIEPSYEIWDCPDGEATLAKIERIGRICYKSEDKIDDGRERCPTCTPHLRSKDDFPLCPSCSGSGVVQVREPSSHAFVRMILRTNRRECLVRELKEEFYGSSKIANMSSGGTASLIERCVNKTLDSYRDDPPHDGLLEHASVTVHFTVSRGFTHELVRHRHASFAMESSRYCNYSKNKFGSSITVIKRSFELEEQIEAWMHVVGEVEHNYMELIKLGVKPEIARDLLTQATKASITLTANFNSLRNFFRKRCSPRAHPDMRALMTALRDDLRKRIPIVFDELI
jgi:thymidylate synthase (FAD)